MTKHVEPLLGVDTAASILALRRRTLMDWARRGEIPCIVLRRGRDGRATIVRFEESKLKEWIEAKRTSSVKRTLSRRCQTGSR